MLFAMSFNRVSDGESHILVRKVILFFGNWEISNISSKQIFYAKSLSKDCCFTQRLYSDNNTRHINSIPSFLLRNNSVHLHECYPFWIGILLLLTKKTTMFIVLCRHAHSDWQSTETFLYVIGKSNICKHVNILLSLTLKENTISNVLQTYTL